MTEKDQRFIFFNDMVKKIFNNNTEHITNVVLRVSPKTAFDYIKHISVNCDKGLSDVEIDGMLLEGDLFILDEEGLYNDNINGVRTNKEKERIF